MGKGRNCNLLLCHLLWACETRHHRQTQQQFWMSSASLRDAVYWNFDWFGMCYVFSCSTRFWTDFIKQITVKWWSCCQHSMQSIPRIISYLLWEICWWTLRNFDTWLAPCLKTDLGHLQAPSNSGLWACSWCSVFLWHVWSRHSIDRG